jgi:DNA-directed RNA polymerase subunit N (RpoN/RPB10)
MRFDELVAIELEKARRKHPGPQRCKHESLGVVEEEFEEFKKAVFQDEPPENILKELAHTAAMCQRAAEDLKLI